MQTPLSSFGRRADLEALTSALSELQRRREARRIDTFYPSTGPLRRELYPKHMSFFSAGAHYRQRLMLAANRIGKTEGVGAYETVLHLTGEYPEWWMGRRFDRPIKAWAAGDTTQTVRDIAQAKLCGPINELGSGMIPGELMVSHKRKAGSVPDCIETMWVRHKSGGLSCLTFKTYEQGRKSFQGTEQDLIWLDEEPPMDVYQESLIRTMTTNGMLLLTFTPLSGMTEVCLSFLPGGRLPGGESDETNGQRKSKFVVMATWDDAPHLSEDDKVELLAEIPEYQRDARSKGVPQLGSGAIYRVREEDIRVPDFDLPRHWPRGYAMDVGWNWTAISWFAWDRENDVAYIYATYKQGHKEPYAHAAVVKKRGSWMIGTVDPASQGANQKDGTTLLQEYEDEGLVLIPANNAVEAGIHKVWKRLKVGALKVFASCTEFFEEYRLYRRDDKGKVVKQNDHVMDTVRYGVMELENIMTEMPVDEAYPDRAARYLEQSGADVGLYDHRNDASFDYHGYPSVGAVEYDILPD